MSTVQSAAQHSDPDGRDHRLKKAASRAGTTIMQKTGQIERTVDREFAEEEGRYRTYVSVGGIAMGVVQDSWSFGDAARRKVWGQRAESKEQRAESREQRTALCEVCMLRDAWMTSGSSDRKAWHPTAQRHSYEGHATSLGLIPELFMCLATTRHGWGYHRRRQIAQCSSRCLGQGSVTTW